MSSLWRWCLFPTGDQDHSGPSSGQPCYLCSWMHTYPPLSSAVLSRPTRSATGHVREKIIALTEGLATFLQVLAFFIHGLLWRKLVLNKETPKGWLALLGVIRIKFLSIFPRYFPSTFKLGIINLWFMNSLKLKTKKLYVFLYFSSQS